MKKTGEKENSQESKKDDEEQSRRFVEAAESLGYDKSGKAFKKFLDSSKIGQDDSERG